MQKNMKTALYSLMLTCLALWHAPSAYAQLLLYDGYDYDESSTFPNPSDGTLNGGVGWDGGWVPSSEEPVNTSKSIVAAGLTYTDSKGNRLQTSGRALNVRAWGGSGAKREFDTSSTGPAGAAGMLNPSGSFGKFGTTIWISVLAEGRDESGETPAMSGFEFKDTNLQGANRSLNMGRPWMLALDGTTDLEGSTQNETYGFFRKRDKIVRANPAMVEETYQASGVDAGSGAGNAEKVFMVLKLDFKGTFDEIAEVEFSLQAGDYGTNVSAWINPDLDAEPQVGVGSFADEVNYWEMSFTQVNAGGNANAIYDELRIGTTYASVAPIAVGVDGDFDGDLDVDGADFLGWQRGESPNGAGAADLALWEGNYGTAASVVAIAGVPEPSSILLLGMSLAGFASCRRRLKR